MSPGTFGILLAGGRGERLHLDRPKALAPLGGRTLLERACGTLASVTERVVVVAPANITLPLPGAATRLFDPGEGPLGALAIGSSTLAPDRALVLGVDFPFVSAALLTALLERLSRADAVVPRPGGRWQPLVAAYSARGLGLLGEAFARGERSVTNALPALAPLAVTDEELERLSCERESLADVDTPESLAEAERRMRAAGERPR